MLSLASQSSNLSKIIAVLMLGSAIWWFSMCFSWETSMDFSVNVNISWSIFFGSMWRWTLICSVSYAGIAPSLLWGYSVQKYWLVCVLIISGLISVGSNQQTNWRRIRVQICTHFPLNPDLLLNMTIAVEWSTLRKFEAFAQNPVWVSVPMALQRQFYTGTPHDRRLP